MENIVFITGNLEKLREAKELLDTDISHKQMDLDEIQSLDPKKVIEHKLNQAYDLLKQPVFVEDVSLELSSLNGFPGPLIKFFEDSLGIQKICDLVHSFEDDKVIARATIGFQDETGVSFFEGVINGRIAKNPVGENGFGWDSIFIKNGFSKTFAQMSTQEKNEESHRSIAFKKFKEWLSLQE